MLSIRDYNFKDKKVLVRCDFNVPIEGNKIKNDFRIQKTLPTVEYLKNAGAKVILLSHMKRPDAQNQKFCLKIIVPELEKFLKTRVKFSSECIGMKTKQKTEKLKSGEILLLENLRHHKGEEENDKEFAKSLAGLGEAYINEAFSVCHRSHASLVLLPKLLPHFAGLQLEKEVESLTRISKAPKRPLSVIIGGAEIGSEIRAIEKLIEFADHILFGGEVANILLRVKGICIGKPWPKDEICHLIRKINLTEPKIHLPVDILVSPDRSGNIYIRETGAGSVRQDEEALDIGRETIAIFSEIIKNSQTIFWSGGLGYFENEKFSQGTKEIAKVIAQKNDCFAVAGGGDTVYALKEYGVLDKFSFVSTGGTAMLCFLAGEKLPGLEALN
jgi:phosphoglycerate kinase